MLPVITDPVHARLTLDGLNDMLRDARQRGVIPLAVLVSEHDRRDLNQELLDASVTPVAAADQRPEHDGRAIGMVAGVPVYSSSEVSRGKARLVLPKKIAEG